jgi:glycosyltransferase involved in cell wall biosynthesis
MLAVTYFYREPRKTGLSIEGIFQSVKASLQGKVAINEFYCDAKLSRVQNTKQAGKQAGTINHITGDVNFLAMGLRGRKNILTIHDLGYYENPVHSRLKKIFYELFWFTLPLKYIDIVTVVSEFTKEKLMRYFNFPEHRIRVIPDPVKPVFHFVRKEVVSGKPVVLMLGTGKHKNLDNLIEAAKNIDVHLDIVGWPAPDELEKLKQYGISHTVYNGLTDEQVQERYAACDILFIASYYEGFGMPIIEAQTVGRPVITSNIGAMLEVGKGSTLLVDPHSPAEIRNAINSLSDRGLYDELVEKGIKNAAKYDYRKIAEQYLSVYEELNELKRS